jgi:hypothetical protein
MRPGGPRREGGKRVNATARPRHTEPVPLRLHRPAVAALARIAPAVCREFGDADALAQLRAARQLGRLARDPDAAAAALVLVQLAIDRLEADAVLTADAVGELLDATHAHYRAGLREFIRASDRKKYALEGGRGETK